MEFNQRKCLLLLLFLFLFLFLFFFFFFFFFFRYSLSVGFAIDATYDIEPKLHRENQCSQTDEKNGGKISEGSNDDNECGFKSRFHQKITLFTTSTHFSTRNSKIRVSRAQYKVLRIFYTLLAFFPLFTTLIPSASLSAGLWRMSAVQHRYHTTQNRHLQTDN